MSVQLSAEATKQALASLQRYCTEELEFELNGLQARMLLNFVLKESAYNAGVAAAEVFLRDRVADLEGVHEAEFAYWPVGTSVRRK